MTFLKSQIFSTLDSMPLNRRCELFDEKWFILSNVLVPQNIIVVVEAGPAQQMHRPETCFIVSALTLTAACHL